MYLRQVKKQLKEKLRYFKHCSFSVMSCISADIEVIEKLTTI